MDLEVYYYDNMTSFSELVKELLEYTIRVAEEKYDLSIYYEVRRDDASVYPYMVVNDLPPIVFDEEPNIDLLLKILIMSSNTPILYNGISRDFGLANTRIY